MKTCNSIRMLILALVPLVAVLSFSAVAKEPDQDVDKATAPSVEKASSPVAGTPNATPLKETTAVSVKPAQQYTVPLPQSNQTPLPSPGAPAHGEQINWQVISSGGGIGVSDNYQMGMTVGQTVAGASNSDNYAMYMGFWQDFGGDGCCQGPTAGNVDCEGIVDIGDVTELITLLFIRVGDPFCCEDEADLDYNGDIDIGDLTILINKLFITVTDPPPCP